MASTRGEHVLIAGAGPTGLCLAGELALAGVRCTVVERRTHRSRESRALGLQARTMELLDQRGLADTVLARGNVVPQLRVSVVDSPLDLGRLPSRYRHVTVLPQGETEEVLEARARELGVTIERGVTLTGCAQEGDEVVCRLESGDRRWEERAAWVVGCDGAKSRVREAMGVGFAGETYPFPIVVADVRLGAPPPEDLLVQVGRAGAVVCVAFGDGWHRVALVDPAGRWSERPVEPGELRTALTGFFGRDLAPGEPRWTSRFRLHERQATAYRRGRVLLAGDAAHVHSPLGGQGLNLGLADAVNLGWKLAAVARGTLPESLLDTYEEERYPVAAGVIAATDRATRLLTSGAPPARLARWAGLSAVTGVPALRRRAVRQFSGLAVAYRSAADPHSPRGTAGHRVPDLSVRTASGADEHLHRALRAGRFVLLDQGEGDPVELPAPWDDLTTVVRGRIGAAEGPWPRCEAILVRPDGYCAWAGPRERAAAAVAALSRRWGAAPTGAPKAAGD
ncbi:MULTISPECIES: FAD-dependent monooxygenase [Streptomyces]|uniref:FAD-dependent monooxygenase n=1 Tax=Streptomyces TaxID=1883 RepID=UPI0022488568|nr:FAD-dependent monooxygenase [Streptomyces sp. JHD 1]MCX2967563.1 FAD-dependent monooxygenase [Streptomyces sp. JHD 1]